jgi:peptide deformylase
MILPVYAFGQPVLKKKAIDVTPNQEGLGSLIQDMWETMYHAHGVGLAAPQIGKSFRLFVVDTEQLKRDEGEENGIKKVFINAQIVEESGDFWSYEEGCLSIPDIRGDVERQKKVRIRYLDENFVPQDEEYDGINARVIQHEYDHIEGILFIEHLKPIKKTLIRRKLEKIKTGQIDPEYRMKFAALK